MNPNADLLAALKTSIVERLRLTQVSPESIADDAPLFGPGLGLDSIDAVELVVMLEKEYGVRMTDLAVAKSAFINVRTLAQFVADSRTAKTGE